MQNAFTYIVTSLVFSGVVGTAAATTINFDDVANGAVINNHYAGVTFSNPLNSGDIYARNNTGAASAPNVVSVLQTGFPAFDARNGAVEAVFATGQQHVSIGASIVRAPEGLSNPINSPVLEIYNTSDLFVGRIFWDFGTTPQPPVGGISAFQTLSYTSTAADIGRIRFLSGQPGDNPSNFAVFDNLVMSAVPEPETYAMLLTGLGLLGWRMRNVRR